MSWWAVATRPPIDDHDAVAEWLARETGQAVLEAGDGTVVGYASDHALARSLAERVSGAFASLPPPSLAAVPDEDWSTKWRDGMACRRIGRIICGPSWLLEPGPSAVVIDPEMAFGTGEHGSTRSVLALLERHLVPGSRVLDVGSGSGILAIAAAKLGAGRIIGVEVDPEAEPIARANLTRNGVAGSVELVTGDASALAVLLGPTDLILSNILRNVNTALLPTFAASLAEGGAVIFGGMETSERAAFLETLGGGGFVGFDEAEDAGWWAVAARPQ